MSRVIKFRGLELMTGDWVHGSHIKTGTGSEYIVPQNLIANLLPQYAVDRNTVSQFTGLRDKNGVEIYEGDIVRKTLNGKESFFGQVIYSEGTYFVELPPEEYVFLFDEHQIYENEVIGNIYEHPELLEAAQ